jgi:hypothetical protein
VARNNAVNSSCTVAGRHHDVLRALEGRDYFSSDFLFGCVALYARISERQRFAPPTIFSHNLN